MPHLKRLPPLPELRTCPRIRKLTRVTINRPRAVNLPQSTLHLRKLETHLFRLGIRQRGNSPLVDGPRGGEAKVRRRLRDVEVEHLHAVFVGDGFGRALVDAHGVAGEAAVFLEGAVHEVEDFCEFRGATLDGLFEEVS